MLLLQTAMAHMKKNCFKYKEILIKKVGPGADGAVPVGNNWIKAA